jgi:hypothetical protein
MAVDQKVFADSKHGPLACVDCHKDLATLQEFPHPEKLAKVACASCHDEEGAKYHDSIHAFAKEKAGLTGAAPACADCHGTHDIRGTDDKAGRVFRANIPATCGSCHQGCWSITPGCARDSAEGGQRRSAGLRDCHTAHTIQRADNDKFRLDVTAECGTCHSQVVESFRRTFHGKVTELGFVRVAACADCHGAHDILPASNAASKVAKANLVQTCSACHAGANESFVKYDPHPNPHSYQRSPVDVVGQQVLHGSHCRLLWVLRTPQRTVVPPVLAKWRRQIMSTLTVQSTAHSRAAPRPKPTFHVRRFDSKTRALHIVVMTTFLVLSATGIPLLFSEAPWARCSPRCSAVSTGRPPPPRNGGHPAGCGRLSRR